VQQHLLEMLDCQTLEVVEVVLGNMRVVVLADPAL
jgi:hypothetical protein